MTAKWYEEETEKFWEEVLDDDVIIVNGVAYHTGRENEYYDGDKGYEGHHFTIKFTDGRIIETTNLWYNGVIPEKYHMKNNAEFIPDDFYCKEASVK